MFLSLEIKDELSQAFFYKTHKSALKSTLFLKRKEEKLREREKNHIL